MQILTPRSNPKHTALETNSASKKSKPTKCQQFLIVNNATEYLHGFIGGEK